MRDPHWLRLQQIVDLALDADPGARAEVLDRECSGDAEIRAEAERLLLSCERAEGFLRQPAPALAGGIVPAGSPARRPPPDRIGPYRILREAGQGGMGTVYLAERDDGQFEMRVALKLVREGPDTGGILRRFLEERQILARLDHPRIARLLDGGVTPEGAPYLVMEFVEGEPIDRYCDDRRLPLNERLKLFIEVCRAVQYAHQNLVVHRDLKPGNILVNAAGEPKLLDFGIAKLLDDGHADAAWGLTRTGVRPMTPEFASPEQVRGDSVTTASDVYALGLLLYLLLCGRHPYGHGRRSAHELEMAVLEIEAKAPSTAVRRALPSGSADTLAASRATTPERLGRRLRGDLDAIVLRALRKEPDLRYATVDQLAQDLQRHLSGRPVLARRGTRAYRASRLIRRHRVAVTAAGVVALSLVGGVGATAWQARVASGERDRARAEMATAARVSAFLEELFRVSDPAEGLGATVTARELLDRGSARIGRELAAEPGVQTALMAVMGRAYGNLGEYARAEALLETTVDARRRLLGDSHPDVGAALLDLARVRAARGDLAGAEASAREALRLAQLETPGGERLAAALARLGGVLHQKGELAAAESHLREALALRRQAATGDDARVAETLGALAPVLRSRGELTAAEPLYREALAIQRRSLGADHPDVATTLNDLAVLLYQREDYEGSAALMREALEVRRRVLGNEHPDVAMTINNLAAVVEKQGDLAQAEPLYREALALKRDALGDDHPSVSVSMNNLALLLSNRGDHAGADTLLRQTLALRRRLLGTDHPSVASAMHNLASELDRGGDGVAAEALYREALELRERLLGRDHPDVATTSVGLALLIQAHGQHEESEGLLRDALRIRRLRLPSGSWQTAAVESALGECLLAQGRVPEAAPLLRSGYATLLRERGPDDRATLRARANLRRMENRE